MIIIKKFNSITYRILFIWVSRLVLGKLKAKLSALRLGEVNYSFGVEVDNDNTVFKFFTSSIGLRPNRRLNSLLN